MGKRTHLTEKKTEMKRASASRGRVIAAKSNTGPLLSFWSYSKYRTYGTWWILSQPESIYLTSDHQQVSDISNTDQPSSISVNANLLSSDMDIIGIHSSFIISDSVQVTVEQGHTSVVSSRMEDTVSDSGE